MYIHIIKFIYVYVHTTYIYVLLYTCTYMNIHVHECMNMYIHVCTMFRHVYTVLQYPVRVGRIPDVKSPIISIISLLLSQLFYFIQLFLVCQENTIMSLTFHHIMYITYFFRLLLYHLFLFETIMANIHIIPY